MLPCRIAPDISLELLEPRHAEALYALVDSNRVHLREWLPWVDATRSVADINVFIDGCRRQLADNNGFQTVIRVGDELAGVIGQHSIDWRNRATSLGYWLAEDMQGQGIMTRACRAHVEHAFGALNLHRVEIRCAVENARSRAIPERLGFRSEGVARDAEWLYDHFVDLVVYGLLVSEWHVR